MTVAATARFAMKSVGHRQGIPNGNEVGFVVERIGARDSGFRQRR